MSAREFLDHVSRGRMNTQQQLNLALDYIDHVGGDRSFGEYARNRAAQAGGAENVCGVRPLEPGEWEGFDRSRSRSTDMSYGFDRGERR